MNENIVGTISDYSLFYHYQFGDHTRSTLLYALVSALDRCQVEVILKSYAFFTLNIIRFICLKIRILAGFSDACIHTCSIRLKLY